MRELSHLVLTSKDSFSRLFLQRNKSVRSICLYIYSNSFPSPCPRVGYSRGSRSECHNYRFGFTVHNAHLLHRLKNVHEFLASHSEVTDGIAYNEFRNWLNVCLKHDGTPQAWLHPYLMTTSGAQRLQSQPHQQVAELLDGDVRQLLHSPMPLPLYASVPTPFRS